MGIIKLEIDVPDFDKELNINVTLKRDGEVVESISSPLKEAKSGKTKKEKQPTLPEVKPFGEGGIPLNGNLMDMEY